MHISFQRYRIEKLRADYMPSSENLRNVKSVCALEKKTFKWLLVDIVGTQKGDRILSLLVRQLSIANITSYIFYIYNKYLVKGNIKLYIF